MCFAFCRMAGCFEYFNRHNRTCIGLNGCMKQRDTRICIVFSQQTNVQINFANMFINVVRWILNLSIFIYLFLSIQVRLHLLHAICSIFGTRLRQSQFRQRINFSQTRFPMDSISYLCSTTLTTIHMLVSTLLFVYQIFGAIAEESFVVVKIDFLSRLILFLYQLFYFGNFFLFVSMFLYRIFFFLKKRLVFGWVFLSLFIFLEIQSLQARSSAD